MAYIIEGDSITFTNLFSADSEVGEQRMVHVPAEPSCATNAAGSLSKLTLQDLATKSKDSGKNIASIFSS